MKMLTTATYRMLPMRSTCPQTKYLFDTEGTPILSEEVGAAGSAAYPQVVSIFFAKVKGLVFGNRDQGNLQCEKTSLRFFFAGA